MVVAELWKRLRERIAFRQWRSNHDGHAAAFSLEGDAVAMPIPMVNFGTKQRLESESLLKEAFHERGRLNHVGRQQLGITLPMGLADPENSG